jgi:competence protein ComEA
VRPHAAADIRAARRLRRAATEPPPASSGGDEGPPVGESGGPPARGAPGSETLPAGAVDLAAIVPPTWLEDLVERCRVVPAPRMLGGALALVVAAVLAWVLLAPDPPRSEDLLPLASAAVTGVAGDHPGGGDDGASVAAGAGGAGATAGGATPDGDGADGSGSSAGTGTAHDAVIGAASGDGEWMLVHAAGALRAPGLYRVPSGARVGDLVHAAGGPTPDADLDRLNLAHPLVDGMRVYVPRMGEDPPPAALVEVPPGGDASLPEGAPPPLIDLNIATGPELETLPGVGPATAAAILEHRAVHGPFRQVDELIAVRGIGEAKLAAVRDLVTVG